MESLDTLVDSGGHLNVTVQISLECKGPKLKLKTENLM